VTIRTTALFARRFAHDCQRTMLRQQPNCSQRLLESDSDTTVEHWRDSCSGGFCCPRAEIAGFALRPNDSTGHPAEDDSL